MKPEEISDWISNAEENGSPTMILNCAMDDRLHRKLERSGLRHECLYEGDKALELDQVAPYLLVPRKDNDFFNWLFEEGRGENWFVLLVSNANFPKTLDHLRRFVLLPSSSGGRKFFRFYDPRVFRECLPALEPRTRRDFFGPIRSFHVEDENGEPVEFAADEDLEPEEPDLFALSEELEDLNEPWRKRLFREQAEKFEETGFKVEENWEERLFRLTDVAGATSTIHLIGNGIRLVTAEGREFVSRYGKDGVLESSVDPAGFRVDLERNGYGELTRLKRSDGREYRFDYEDSHDLRERTMTVLKPDGSAEKFLYSNKGYLKEFTDGEGGKVLCEYNDLYGYVTSITDPNGFKTVFEYGDELLAPLATVYPDGTGHQFQYDDERRLKRFLVNREEYATFDPGDGFYEIKYADGGYARRETDGDSLKEMRNESFSVKLEHDEFGNVALERTRYFSVGYERNQFGNLIALELAGTRKKERIVFERDKDQRIVEVRDWDGGVYRISYSKNGAIREISYPNGVVQTRETNPLGRPLLTSLRSEEKMISDVACAYDDLDRLESLFLTDYQYKYVEFEEKLFEEKETRSLIYDRAGRLVEIEAPLFADSERFDPDPNGNDLNKGSCNSLDQSERISGEETSRDGVGNMTSGFTPLGKAELVWNRAGRLVRVSTPKGVSEYRYDGFGRRITKTFREYTTSYVWSGKELVREETLDEGLQVSFGRDYLFVPGLPAPLAIREATRTLYLHHDFRFAVTEATDRYGQVVWRGRYRAFGACEEEGEAFQPFRLAGQYHDAETGLNYACSRYYDPASGRYLSKDPLLLEGGSFNFYLYCDGDPFNRIDPTGESSKAVGSDHSPDPKASAAGSMSSAGAHPKPREFDWSALDFKGKERAVGVTAPEAAERIPPEIKNLELKEQKCGEAKEDDKGESAEADPGLEAAQAKSQEPPEKGERDPKKAGDGGEPEKAAASQSAEEDPPVPFTELSYLHADGTGVPGALYIITAKTKGGETEIKGTLNGDGHARVDLPMDVLSFKYGFDDDPKALEEFAKYKGTVSLEEAIPMNVDKSKTTLEKLGDLVWGGLKWTGGVLLGDFSEHTSISQIIARTVIGMIPIVGEIGDVEDLIADIKHLAWDRKYEDPWTWTETVMTLFGFIPLAGAAAGLVKAVFFSVKIGKASGLLNKLIKVVNRFAKGNAVKWLKSFSGDIEGYGDEIASKFKSVLEKLIEVLTKVEKYLVLEKLKRKVSDLLEGLKMAASKSESMIKAEIKHVKKTLDEAIEKAERFEKGGSVNGKSETRQRVEVAPAPPRMGGPSVVRATDAAGTKTTPPPPANDKKICGEPVDAVTGEVVSEETDFVFEGRIPLEWRRLYNSGEERAGVCGRGWTTPADAVLETDAEGKVYFRNGTFDVSAFTRLPEEDELLFNDISGTELYRDGGFFVVRDSSKLEWRFRHPGEDFESLRLDKIEDSRANFVRFAWSDQGLDHIVDSSGQRLEAVSEDGFLKELRLVESRMVSHKLVSYEYSKGLLSAVRDALENPRRFSYENGLLISHTDRNGLSFHYEYDGEIEPRCVRAWGDGGLYDYGFQYLEGKTVVTDSLKNSFELLHNEKGQLLKEVDSEGGETVFEYDYKDRLSAIVDRGGRRTEYAYTDRGDLDSIVRPDGKKIDFDYDEDRNPVLSVDPEGGQWRSHWDKQGNPAGRSTAEGHRTSYELDRSGDLGRITDPLGAETVFERDERGRPTAVVDAEGRKTEYRYDVFGNVVMIEDPYFNKTRYAYDAKSRLVEIEKPSGSKIACEYDAEDNLTLYRDENGRETRFEYGGVGEVAKRINPDGTFVTYEYDTEERLTAVRDENGRALRFLRDHQGRVTEEVDYWGNSRKYEYSPAGELLASVDPLGRKAVYEHDVLGRLERKLYSNGSFEEYKYDANGNLVFHANGEATVERRFDGDGNLIREEQDGAIVENEYDAAGNRVRRSTSHENEVEFRHDKTGAAIAAIINGGEPINIRRDRRGFRVSETFGDHYRKYEYDDDGFLTGQEFYHGSRRINLRQYEYDPAGNLTAKKDLEKGGRYFAYDPMGRVEGYKSPEEDIQRFLHDPAGDLLKDRIRSHDKGGREAELDGTVFRFDACGNLIEKRDQGRTDGFEWSEDGTLRRFEDVAGNSASMRYDALGRRTFKEENGRKTGFGWDGDRILSDRIEGKEAREYVFYPGTFEPLALIDEDKKVYIYQNDQVGAPNELIGEDGKVVWSASYGALGEIERFHVNEIAQPLRLQGQYHDGVIGLYYNRHRYYDPSVGSFISRDPLGLEAGTNLYSYAPNVNGWVDPLGLICNNDSNNNVSNNVLPSGTSGTGNSYNKYTGQGLYVLRDQNDVVRYVGIGDVPTRLKVHANTPGKSHLKPQVIHEVGTLTKAEARGLEAHLMGKMGGPQSMNPNSKLLNIGRSFTSKNPNAKTYRQAATKDLIKETMKILNQW